MTETPVLFIVVLRYAFLLALVLFVARVLRVVLADLEARTAGPASRAVLVVEAPEMSRGREFLVAGEATVGRAPGCAIVLSGDYVSAHHARLFERDGRVWVEDLGSTNGTLLNGRRVRRAVAMRSGDRLRIGDVVLGLRLEAAPEPAADGTGSWPAGDGGRG
ncbi:MAG TPA: FHA domain-containing protein [bacterium]|nr:FHA domain-containing protein [bacterium]